MSQAIRTPKCHMEYQNLCQKSCMLKFAKHLPHNWYKQKLSTRTRHAPHKLHKTAEAHDHDRSMFCLKNMWRQLRVCLANCHVSTVKTCPLSRHLHTYSLTHLHTYTLTHVHTYTRTHVHTYTLTHLHTYTRLHTLTHTHTQ